MLFVGIVAVGSKVVQTKWLGCVGRMHVYVGSGLSYFVYIGESVGLLALRRAAYRGFVAQRTNGGRRRKTVK